MARIKKTEQQEIPKEDFGEVKVDEDVKEVLGAPQETAEARENLSSENVQQLREKIEKMDVDDSLKIQAQSQATQIKSLAEEEKLKELLRIAKEKGVVYCINVAKKMNDPYILDILHDTLVKEGYYKKFLK